MTSDILWLVADDARPGDTVTWTDDSGRAFQGVLQSRNGGICLVRVWDGESGLEGKDYEVECARLKVVMRGTT